MAFFGPCDPLLQYYMKTVSCSLHGLLMTGSMVLSVMVSYLGKITDSYYVVKVIANFIDTLPLFLLVWIMKVR